MYMRNIASIEPAFFLVLVSYNHTQPPPERRAHVFEPIAQPPPKCGAHMSISMIRGVDMVLRMAQFKLLKVQDFVARFFNNKTKIVPWRMQALKATV
jgi:hypothetical protein